MVFALADVQAEEGTNTTDVDHARPPVVPARPSHGTDRHIHITKASRPAKKPVVMPLISGLFDASGAGDTTPQAINSTGGDSHANSEGRAAPLRGPPRR